MDIEKIIQKYKFFIDTCSLLHENSEEFFFKELPNTLIANSKTVIIPDKVIEEVKRLQNYRSEKICKDANRAAMIVNNYLKHKIVDVRGESNDPFADNVFQYVFTKFRTKHNLALLTQDVALAKDITNLKKTTSIKSNYEIEAFKLTRNGKIIKWDFWEKKSGIINRKTYSKNKTIKEPEVRKYRICQRPKELNEPPIKVTSIPTSNDIVVCNGGKVRLKDEIGKGGEGSIYATTLSNMVCKIYNKQNITKAKLAKINLMLKNKLHYPGICWPENIVTNEQGEFVGYVMASAKGIPMQKAIFVKPLLMKNFPHWKREHLAKLALTILEKIVFLHERNVLIGDINPLNILIESESDVNIVDTDSC